MTIGQVAGQAEVNVQTVRFYERKGLIAQAPRSASGYRQYTAETVRRIRFIKHAQEIGFSLREIDELLCLRLDPHTTCPDIQQQALRKVAEIEQRMASLEQMKQALTTLARQCSLDKTLSDCPILDALDEHHAEPAR